MLNETELQELLLQYKDGTLAPEGRTRLDEWAESAPENKMFLELLSDDSRLTDGIRKLYTYDDRRVWGNILREVSRRRRRLALRRLLQTTAAAAVLAVGVLAFDAYRESQEFHGFEQAIQPGRTMAVLELSSGEKVCLTDVPANSILEADESEIRIDSASVKITAAEKPLAEPLINTITVPRGCEYPVELSDGTKVWLNSESEMRFPTRFDPKERVVELRGEAYFEVKSDPSHPFIVMTEQMSVEVLGTSFNLMTYDDEPQMEATLITGSLRVRRDKQEALLVPGMQAQFDRRDNTMTVRPVYAESYAAWARHMFVFFNEPIESICRKLTRWYDVPIDASSPRLKGIRYSGMIRRAESFNNIIELLSTTDELTFSMEDGKVIVDTK